MVGVKITFEDGIDALNWSQRGGDKGLRLAVTSRSPDENLLFKVGIIGVNPRQVNRTLTYFPLYLRRPVDDIAFIYDPEAQYPDFLATASDRFRLWKIDGHSFQLMRVYPNIFPPNTNDNDNDDVVSIHWNRDIPRRMAAVFTKGSGVVWDLETARSLGRWPANGRYNFIINDISWGGRDVLAAGYEGGWLHSYDIRQRRACQIYYAAGHVIYRVEWNDMFPNFLGITLGDERVLIVDPRRPGELVAQLDSWRPGRVVADMEPHGGEEVHSIAWDPTKGNRICTTGSDFKVAVHDIPGRGNPVLFGDHAGDTTGWMSMKWSLLWPEWLAFAYGNTLELLEVEEMSHNDHF